MKKIIQITSVVVAMFCAGNLSAQTIVPAGSIAPNFTFVDLNSNTQDLYTYLNSGKTVFVDVSATWCGPCWSFHNTRSWDTLFMNHGPSGMTNVSSSTTNDVMVLFVEGDNGTTDAEMNGVGSSTQGNWVAGNKFPMINDNTSNLTPFLNFYFPSGALLFPTLFMICPDKSVREVTSQDNMGNFNIPASYYYNLISSTPCNVATSGLDASINNTITQSLFSACGDSISAVFTLTNESTVPLTSATIKYSVDGTLQKTINWAGNLAVYASIQITNIKLFGTSNNTHTITATVSNPNGGTDINAANNSVSNSVTDLALSATVFPSVSEGFQSTFPPANWGIMNGGDPTITWTNYNAGGYQATTKGGYLEFWNIGPDDIDELILPTVSLVGQTAAKMTFDLSKAPAPTAWQQYDQLKIKVSTDCGANWTTVYNKNDYTGSAYYGLPTTTNFSTEFFPTNAAQWRTDTVNLNAFAGQANVIIKFYGISGYANNLFIDNVNLSATNSIREINNITNVIIYPNPSSSVVNLEIGMANTDNVKINIYSNLGELVYSENKNNLPAGDNTVTFTTDNLPAGLYNVTISTKEGTVNQKLAVTK